MKKGNLENKIHKAKNQKMEILIYLKPKDLLNWEIPD